MVDGGIPVYPPALGGGWVRRWCLRAPGQITRIVEIGTTPDGWWVAASWQMGGLLYCSEPAADAQAVRLREQWPAHPGEWVRERRVTSHPAATVPA